MEEKLRKMCSLFATELEEQYKNGVFEALSSDVVNVISREEVFDIAVAELRKELLIDSWQD